MSTQAIRILQVPTEDVCRKILFLPVTGPYGMGEYHRCLFLAMLLLERHPGWDVRLVVANTAPFASQVPIECFRISRSPTKSPDEVAGILRHFRPDVAVFDCSGRQQSLLLARELGTRTVFVSNHRRKRQRAFRLNRLRYTDEHWIMQPESFGTRCTAKRPWRRAQHQLFIDRVWSRLMGSE